MKASYKKYILDFKRPSGTSRGTLHKKETWFLILKKENELGIGECGLLRGLSVDDVSEYEQKLKWTCDNIHLGKEKLWNELVDFPSIQFGLEQAFMSLESQNPFELFPSPFTDESHGIGINGLVWMGDEAFMHEQIQEKLAAGFTCIKMKIGAIDFNSEMSLLSSIRKKFGKDEIELRVDANGAFKIEEAMEKLKILSQYDLHSIEQPIRQGNISEMMLLCANTPLPIALDEELIGITDPEDKDAILKTIRPQYIILKPSLIGGFKGSMEWINLARKYNIGWWVTSALESNIGLNAIAQWTATLQNHLPQGLGTGSLYTNNIDSPLTIDQGKLYYRKDKVWDEHKIKQICI
ncbi:mandelate racemase [Sediminicola sp. YIK13]|uniref:o-succinylbenzoate synthase n=1 Tax=Sediminicola sp. YIK13 TaxID=1453352 RepID=UPI00071F22B1|nr:o-succinylbenzoate synthase [Sediminicola sp. YIK13]ALM09176.1 mandelate racemase [Sediminicola sp. YIK13]